MAVEAYKIIKIPLISERATDLQAENKYVFTVDKKAKKYKIKEAIETIYKVHVKKINVINVPKKKKKYRMNIEGFRSGYKKAIIKLKEGEKIAIT